jgi:DNA-binding XRE family transcriptional regulator
VPEEILIKQYRAVLGITQRDLGEFLGRPQSYVHYLESGRLLPTDEDAERLAELFRCPRTDIRSRGQQ